MIKNTIIGAAFILSVASACTLALSRQGQKNIAFVDNLKLYSEFEYAKELNKNMEQIVSARKNIIDSLYETVRLKILQAKNKKKNTEKELAELSRMQEEYFYKKEQFEKENQLTANEYNAKAWNQINDLISKYGKEKNYSVIFGANGQGNIMYGEQAVDQTKDAVEYINKKFNDKD